MTSQDKDQTGTTGQTGSGDTITGSISHYTSPSQLGRDFAPQLLQVMQSNGIQGKWTPSDWQEFAKSLREGVDEGVVTPVSGMQYGGNSPRSTA